MGALKTVEMCSSSSSSSIGGGGDYDDDDAESWLSELREKQEKDLKNLSLTYQPFYTLYLFIWATYLHISYILRKGWIFLAIIFFAVATGYLLLPEKHFQECLHFCRYGLWWIILGVASSIGLGYGLHTFVMYLGPHIALFTVRAVECGRIDLKAAPYDTIQWNTHPSWHEKECFYFGLPLFSSLPNSLFSIPLSSILPQIQLEAVLWGIGTALGELPPYFVSRAARKSGNTVDVIEEIDASSSGKGIISIFMKRSKCWLFSRAYHLNFFTILLLASVPNPLFDLAGMMCGQFGIPFWKFFLSTLIGKAIIKTHIQTVFIIILCNNQLLDWMENELVRVLGHIPVFGEMLSKLIFRLKMLKEKILSPPADLPSGAKGKYWGRYFNLIWNAVIWLMMINFVIKIVTSTAKEQLRKQQETKLNKKRSLLLNSGKYNHITEVTSNER